MKTNIGGLKMAVEVTYEACWGSVFTVCPFGEKVKLYNSLHSNKPCGERVRIVGSSDCTNCQYYLGVGRFIKNCGTTEILTKICKHPEGEKYNNKVIPLGRRIIG